MDNILRNLIRLGLVGIYPLILILSFTYLYHKDKYKITIKKHLKHIIINTLVFILIGTAVIFVFFYFEDTIYSYDYAGHWQRSLELRKLFFENPSEILSTVYNSMNYQDYSYLPALFGLGLTIFNTSYGFFCLTIFIYFFIPTTILLQIIYFSFTDKYPYLPLVLFIIFYPLYIPIFYGEVDVIGIFFIAIMYILIIFPDFKDIKWNDIILINLFAFLAIFLRRWYLYPVVAIYLCLFFKYLLYYNFKPFTKYGLKDFIKIVCSGLIMLGIILVFFYPFFDRVLFNNFSEAYEYYDKGSGKLLALINYYSPIILLISALGIYLSCKNNKNNTLYLLILIVLPLGMFWSIQSFEYHHYYMISLNFFLMFVYGLYYLLNIQKVVSYAIAAVLVIQSSIIFYLPFNTMPILTDIRKRPESIDYKEDIVNFASYLNTLTSEDWQICYMASGSTAFNTSLIRNSLLPSLDFPNIQTAELDLRDGFPKDFEYIQYIILTDPILYVDNDYQHIYEVINDAIKYEPLFKDTYQLIFDDEVSGFDVQVYEKISDITPEMKEYFYNQMISYYPEHQNFFSYILD